MASTRTFGARDAIMMIVYFSILCLPVTIISYYLCKHFYLGTENFEGKTIPYSLGIPIIYSYYVIYLLFPYETAFVSNTALVYVTIVWLTGLLDDKFGSRQPKGFRGHFYLLLAKKEISTGLLKIILTSVGALIVVINHVSLTIGNTLLMLLLLLLTPHVMNLFDTRPLRTIKVSILYLLTLVPMVLIPISIYFLIGILVYLIYLLESRKMAMLGDNGATLIGGILALLTIFYAPIIQQWLTLAVLVSLTILAEKVSFTNIIERYKLLKKLDLIGNFPEK